MVVALGATFLLYGNWLIDKESLLEVGWNASLFPWSIPIGLALLAVALFKVKEWRLAITASPMLSPYTSTGSWAVALIGLIGYPAWMVGITFGAWILYLYLGVKFIIR